MSDHRSRAAQATRKARLLGLSALAATLAAPAWAQQTAPVQLPTVTVEDTRLESLTAPSTERTRKTLNRTPGSVSVVDGEEWGGTTATTLKDMLEYTPGIFVQPKWGEDSRISIRGSGLARNFHLRGVMLLQDGVPINSSDGSGDFQEVDPTAYRHVEVYKGANALRYGAATLGGALNFVTPTGYDADLIQGRAEIGSFGARRLQASTGGVVGKADGFVTSSWLQQQGFRDHSTGESNRTSGNVGLKLSDDIETRFYATIADIYQQIPGSVTKSSALNSPQTAAAANTSQHYQRNIDMWRVANKTAFQLGPTKAEVGGFWNERHLIHPIFQFLDYEYRDWGAFGRVTDDRAIAGHDNHLTLGVNLSGGWVDNRQYVNRPGAIAGSLLSASQDRSRNIVVYGDNSFDVVKDVALVTGLQYVRANRQREDKFTDATRTGGNATYSFLNPKLGAIWTVLPNWQVFGNLSRSGEPPSFGEINFSNATLGGIRAQKANTAEIGTRGKTVDTSWDVALYRSHLRDEFQFFDLGGGNIQVTNASKTMHQGIEAGGGWTFWRGLFEDKRGKDGLNLRGAYTFSDFRFVNDPVWGNNQLPGAPRHFIRAELVYRHPSGFHFGPNVEASPQAYYVDNANSVDTEPYFLIGARAGYDLNEYVSFFLDGRNLENKKYISSASSAGIANANSALFEPGTGRAIYGGVRIRW